MILAVSDNPSHFIGGTAARAPGEGEILLSLEDGGEADLKNVRVGIAAIGFAPG